MIERIESKHAGLLALEAVGTIEASDYEDVLKPAIEEAIAGGGKIRLVFLLGDEYEGYSAGAAWEDAKLWIPRITKWERCALVTDHRWLADTVRLFRPLMPGEIEVFPVSRLDDALDWAAA
jgi:hypothetical protein